MVMGDATVEAGVVVVGGGPGGYTAAFRAADRGLDVALITDEEPLGGVCLIRGCIPSKALLEITGLLERTREASEAGIRMDDPHIDLDALRDWTAGVVAGLGEGLATLADARGVRVIRGRARFESSRRLRLEGGDVSVVEFDHAVLATGSRPAALPGVEFGGRVLDSAAALRLESLPERLLVVGAGYVGLELGTVYARLGSDVTMVEMADRILPTVDPDLTGPLARRLDELFDAVHLDTTLDDLEVGEDGVVTTLDGEEERFDAVLVAVGRRPATDDLGLGHTDVVVRDDGTLRVDEERRTDDSRIFAVGDVTGGVGLAHEAMAEARVAADVLAGDPAAFDVRGIPAVVYTDPQVATCGLDPTSSQAEDLDVDTVRVPLKALGRARILSGGRGDPDGFVKLTTERGTGRILGVGATGREVEGLVAEAALALEMGATATDLALTVHPHPSLSEALPEAAGLVAGGVIHVAPRDGP